MAEQYYTITTNAGDEAIAAALASGTTKTFVYGAVGDGGGNYYELTKDQTALRGEKWRGNCEVSKDPGKFQASDRHVLNPFDGRWLSGARGGRL